MKIYIAIPLYLIFGKVNGYFEGIKGNKYLTLVPTNESKEKIKKYEKLLIKIRDLIRSITKNLDDYDEKYMKIKFDSDGNLSFNKTIEIPIVTIVIRAAFQEKKTTKNKYYPQTFLDECLYKKQMNSKNELREIDIKNCVRYYFDDTINGTKTISAIFY